MAQATIVVRELFLAAQVGLSSTLDALLVGITMPVALAGVLTAGLATALVPAYTASKLRGGPGDARRLAGTVLVWVALAAAIVWAFLVVFAGPIVAVIGSGMAGADQTHAAEYLRVVAPVVLASSLTAILLAICQAERYFVPIALSTVGTAVTSLTLVLALWSELDMMAYAVGSLFGPVAGLVIAFAATVHRSITPSPRIVAHGLGVPALLRHAIPLTVSSSVLQISVVANRAVASWLGPGAISAVRYGELLISVPIGAVGPAWGSAIYPTLVQTTQAPESHGLAATVTRALRFTIAAFIPVAVLTAAMAPVIVAVAYGRGAVTEEQLRLTARVVLCLSPVILIAMTTPVLTGALNARRRGTVLLATGILNVSLNLVLAVVLGLSLGAPGVALATSLATGSATLFLAWRLSLIEVRFRPRALARSLVAGLVAATPAGLVLGTLAWTLGPMDASVTLIAFLAMSTVIVLGSYVVIASRLGVAEVSELTRVFTSRLRDVKKRPSPR